MKVNRLEDMVTKFNAEDEGKSAPQYKLWILLLFLVVPSGLNIVCLCEGIHVASLGLCHKESRLTS